MIQLYDRDAAVVAAVLPLLVDLRRARPGAQYEVAAETLRIWAPADIVEADPQKKQTLIDARLESIVAEINQQHGGSAGANQAG